MRRTPAHAPNSSTQTSGSKREAVGRRIATRAASRTAVRSSTIGHPVVCQGRDADVERQEAVVGQVVADLQRFAQGRRLDLGDAADSTSRCQ